MAASLELTSNRTGNRTGLGWFALAYAVVLGPVFLLDAVLPE